MGKWRGERKGRGWEGGEVSEKAELESKGEQTMREGDNNKQ